MDLTSATITIALLVLALFTSFSLAYSAEQISVKGTYQTTTATTLSNRTTPEGVTYRTLNVKAEMIGDLQGLLEYLVFQEINTKTNKATSTGWGTFTGRVSGKGPGEATFSFVASIEGFNTTSSTLLGQFWNDRGRNGLEGYRLEGTFRSTSSTGGTYEGNAFFGEAAADTSPIPLVILVAGIAIAVVTIIYTRRTPAKKV
ncbi:MAG: hypothetical protein FJ358_01775 [Thaumarchaeota archaeon]|nr:hypothetical protein [Nitrososphaerota archaeon]